MLAKRIDRVYRRLDALKTAVGVAIENGKQKEKQVQDTAANKRKLEEKVEKVFQEHIRMTNRIQRLYKLVKGPKQPNKKTV